MLLCFPVMTSLLLYAGLEVYCSVWCNVFNLGKVFVMGKKDNHYDEFGTIVFNTADWGFAAALYKWYQSFETYSTHLCQLQELDPAAEKDEYKKLKSKCNILNSELEEKIKILTIVVGQRFPTWDKLLSDVSKDTPSYPHLEWEFRNVLEMTNDLNIHEGDSKEMYEWYDFFMNFFYDACFKLYNNRKKEDGFKLLFGGTETTMENQRISILKSITKIRKLQGWYNQK